MNLLDTLETRVQTHVQIEDLDLHKIPCTRLMTMIEVIDLIMEEDEERNETTHDEEITMIMADETDTMTEEHQEEEEEEEVVVVVVLAITLTERIGMTEMVAVNTTDMMTDTTTDLTAKAEIRGKVDVAVAMMMTRGRVVAAEDPKLSGRNKPDRSSCSTLFLIYRRRVSLLQRSS